MPRTSRGSARSPGRNCQPEKPIWLRSSFVIWKNLEGQRIRTVWQSLDEMQRAAVAEVVHLRSPQFPAVRFRAKYGEDPN